MPEVGLEPTSLSAHDFESCMFANFITLAFQFSIIMYYNMSNLYLQIMFSNQPLPPQNQTSPIFHIEVDKIKPNPFQPRRDFDEAALQELAGSIREFGILHPIIVTKMETQTEFGTNVEYQLISGERRWRASQIAGLERIPAIIRAMPSDRERLELAIIENIQREDLNPIETARAYAKLQDQFGLTQREISVKIGKSREAIANSVRLLNLPSQIQDAVSGGKLNESQARLLLMVPDMKEQIDLFNNIIVNNLSVRELKQRIHPKKETGVLPSEAPRKNPELEKIEDQLRELLGTKVKLQQDKDGGKLTISFYSTEELFAIIQKLAPTAKEEIPQNKEEIMGMPDQSSEFIM